MSRLSRLLIVMEPGKDGVFDWVRAFIGDMHRCRPDVRLDLAYSSRRAGDALPLLVEEVRRRGGEAVDLQIGNAPAPEDFAAARKILDLVRRNRPQIVHAHSSKAGALVRLLRLFGSGFPPVVYTPHAYYGLGKGQVISGFFYNTVEGLLGRAGRTVCSSADERRFGLEQLHLPPRKLLVINNGVDMKRFRPGSPSEKSAARAEFGLPATGTVLLTVGRDTAQKNYAPLYHAMNSLLITPGCNCFLAHAGAGSRELGAQLCPAARERFRGFEHVAAIERFLQAGDAFVLTSRYEGLSLSALQALGAGLKMFLSRVPGNRCLARAGFREITWIEPENGLVTSEAIQEAIRPWLENPDPFQGAQVSEARSSYNSSLQNEKIFKLYDYLLPKGR